MIIFLIRCNKIALFILKSMLNVCHTQTINVKLAIYKVIIYKLWIMFKNFFNKYDIMFHFLHIQKLKIFTYLFIAMYWLDYHIFIFSIFYITTIALLWCLPVRIIFLTINSYSVLLYIDKNMLSLRINIFFNNYNFELLKIFY